MSKRAELELEQKMRWHRNTLLELARLLDIPLAHHKGDIDLPRVVIQYTAELVKLRKQEQRAVDLDDINDEIKRKIKLLEYLQSQYNIFMRTIPK